MTLQISAKSINLKMCLEKEVFCLPQIQGHFNGFGFATFATRYSFIRIEAYMKGADLINKC